MFPKQLEGSLVVSRAKPGRNPTVETLVRVMVQEGGTPLKPDRGSKGANALARLPKIALHGYLTAGFWVPKTYLATHIDQRFAIKRERLSNLELNAGCTCPAQPGSVNRRCAEDTAHQRGGVVITDHF